MIGSTYTWSLTNIKSNRIGFPFNQFFPFFLMSILQVLVSLAGLKFKDTLDSRQQENADVTAGEFSNDNTDNTIIATTNCWAEPNDEALSIV